MSKQPEALRLADALAPVCEAIQYCGNGAFGVETVGPIRDSAAELRRLHALNGELLEALKAYSDARSMPIYGDYSAIPWESKAGPVNPAWGGGDCSKHGRWYGMCHCCAEEFDKLRERSDRDAASARNDALRKAEEKARDVIAKAEAS